MLAACASTVHEEQRVDNWSIKIWGNSGHLPGGGIGNVTVATIEHLPWVLACSKVGFLIERSIGLTFNTATGEFIAFTPCSHRTFFGNRLLMIRDVQETDPKFLDIFDGLLQTLYKQKIGQNA